MEVEVEGIESHSKVHHIPIKWMDQDDDVTSTTEPTVTVNGVYPSQEREVFFPTEEVVADCEAEAVANDEKVANNKSEFAVKTLNRGISRANDNVHIVSKVRSELALVDGSDEDAAPCIETPLFMFTLPDFSQYPSDFREFLEKDLISTTTLSSLEQSKHLNWWTAFAQRLWPLSTSGDGNCLLHAASLGMWGFHDRLLTLRKALHVFLSRSLCRDALWRRWKRQQSILNSQSGLVYSEVEWRREWNAIVNMASTVPRLRRQSIVSAGKEDIYGDVYESLEELHVLALAHVLKRPIIVVADTMLKDMNGEALAPIPFGGIYLPMECPSVDCHRSPLLLAYDGGHFSALVAMENSPNTAAIPLVNEGNDLLPVQFCIDPGNDECTDFARELSYDENITLLNEYLDVAKIDPLGNNGESVKQQPGLLGSLGRSVGNKFRFKLSRTNSMKNGKSGRILCALLQTDKRHECHDVMIKNYLQNAAERFQESKSYTPRYGTGKSRFYTELDEEWQKKKLVPAKGVRVANDDPTMYLAKSTFYETGIPCRASGCKFYGAAEYQFFCSKCYHRNNSCQIYPNRD